MRCSSVEQRGFELVLSVEQQTHRGVLPKDVELEALTHSWSDGRHVRSGLMECACRVLQCRFESGASGGRKLEADELFVVHSGARTAQALQGPVGRRKVAELPMEERKHERSGPLQAVVTERGGCRTRRALEGEPTSARSDPPVELCQPQERRDAVPGWSSSERASKL